MENIFQMFLSTQASFSETDYLAFLSKRVPQDLAEQLTRDANPDISISKYINVNDLVRSLSSYSFPAGPKQNSINVNRLADMLDYTIIGYFLDLVNHHEQHNPYKQVYVVSLYLHSCIHGEMRSSIYVGALLVLAKACRQLDFEARLQISRFIGSLVLIIKQKYVSDPAPISIILVILTTIFAGIVCDINSLIEHAMREEDFAGEWRKAEVEYEDKDLSLDEIRALRQSLSEFFGISEKLQEIAKNFLDEDNSKIA